MSDQHIDQIFRQKLSNGKVPVPGDLWDKIEPQLPTPVTSNRWYIFWVIGIGVLLTVAALLWRTGSDENTLEEVATAHTPVLPGIAAGVSLTEPGNAVDALPSPADQLATVTVSSGTVSKEHAKHTAQTQGTSDHINSSQTLALAHGVSFGETPSSSLLQNGVEPPGMLSLINASIGLKANRLMTSSLLSSGVFFLSMSNQRKLPDPTKDCYSFGSRRNKGNGLLFAEVYAGPGFATRDLSSRAEDVSTYIAQRDSTESSRVSWHAGVRAGYLHRSGISVRLGAHYTLVNELFDYVDGSFSQGVIQIDTIFDGGGNILSIDTTLVNQTGKRIKTTHNRYHTIDVPLLLGYQVTQGNWSYGIQAGPVFNVAFIKKGDILSSAGDPVSISDNDSMQYPAFKDKLGLSIYASAQLARRIGYRTWVYAEPYVQKRLSSITLDSYPVDQRQTNIGLSIGLRVTLH